MVALEAARQDRSLSAPVPGGKPRRSDHHFLVALALITLLGTGIRIIYTLGWKQGQQHTLNVNGQISCSLYDEAKPATHIFPRNLCGDAYVFHEGANLLADGDGFITPADYHYGGIHKASADHPPLYTLYLAGFSVLGLRTVLDHQLASVFLGVVTVVLVGLFGRDVFGRRVGLVAAFLAAVYPYIWVNDALVMSETIALTCTVAVVWQAYRFWRSPTIAQAALFGLLGGLLALTRAELVLYVPIVGLAWALGRTVRRDWRRWLRTLAVMGLASLAVMSPWLARNLTTFKYPVTLSTGLGITLAYTNCPEAYSGDLIGYWFFACAQPLPHGVDQSDDERQLRRRGLDYLKSHESQLPAVVAARVGRQWNLFRPNQMTALDGFDNRERSVSRAGLILFYAMIPFAGGAAIVLHRRRISLTPLLTVPVIITVVAAATYGSTRFRVPAELSLVMLAAVGLVASADRWILPRLRRDT